MTGPAATDYILNSYPQDAPHSPLPFLLRVPVQHAPGRRRHRTRPREHSYVGAVRKRLRSDAAVNRAKRAAQLPMRRLAEPDEVARAILFLAGPDNRYITGIGTSG
ncbi:SDR family oxidoreductase [Arthrobacter sp. 2RAF6]|uniref:SDR family oxidoreductase n=1 Tax=Arthrobacter sp. 2RAF6 TaxID=3233002 RepID=UPI003F90FCEF